MQRFTDEAVTRKDCSVGVQPSAGGARIAPVGTDVRRKTLTRSVEVQPAQLERMRKLPNAVEHCSMTLVRSCWPIFPAKILLQRECDQGESAVRRLLGVFQRRERVGDGCLPMVRPPPRASGCEHTLLEKLFTRVILAAC